MSTHPLRLSGPIGGTHPAVLSRRIHDLILLGAAGLIPLIVGLGIAVTLPSSDYALVLGVAVGVPLVVALVASARLERTVLFLAFFLGCIDGPVKLLTAGGLVTSALQDVLIIAVLLGMLMRMIVSRTPVRLPPLTGWVVAFVFVVLIEAFNPKTAGFLKSIAGFRQQLQWVPFFFFGYLLVRSKSRLRKLFLVLGVIALANGVVSTYQTQISPAQLAGWGAGYRAKVYGTEHASARKYVSEGVARVRPMGLGDDSGVGAGFGDIAIAGTFALLATARRRRWPIVLLCLGSMVAIATGLGRLQVVGGVLAVIAYAVLSASAGRRVTRPLIALLAVLLIALPLGVLFISAVGEGVFSRYTSIAPSKVTGTATGYKEESLREIPHYLSAAPFGFGLGTAGSAGGFGGRVTEELEGHNVTAETQYNFLVDELGLPGLLVWTGFTITLILLALRGLKNIGDSELQIYLAAVFAPVVALFLMSFDGPVSASSAAGPYFWFAGGVAAYWLLGPGRALAARRASPAARGDASLAPAT
jgi:hypothetical protein